MASLMPDTPGRGRSRFSKVLPLPPDATAPAKSPALSTASTSVNSPLPPLPVSKISLPPIVRAIPRKAVGMTAEQRALLEALARAANSPMYAKSTTAPQKPADNSSVTMTPSSNQDPEAVTSIPAPAKSIQKEERAKTPEPLASPTTTIQALQHSPPELWRRRSIKSDKNLHFTDLKLDRSNGSTAAAISKQEQPKQEAPAQLLPSNDAPPSRKPVPVAAAPPPEFMGNKIGKLKDKAARTPFQTSSKDESFQSNARPPTPEYINGSGGDAEEAQSKRQLVLPNIISPRSPDTPPEETSPPRIPARSDSRNALSLLNRLLESDSSTTTLQAPETMYTHSRTSSETLTIRSPQPKLPEAKQILNSSYESHPAPQPPNDRSTATQKQKLPPPLVSPIEEPPQSASSRDSRDSTLSIPGVHFPTLPKSSLLPTDAILPSLPITISHLECFQSHKVMRRGKNMDCPVACMICRKRDNESRWRCTWCCLSACATCMQLLTSEDVGKDLSVALSKLEMQQEED